jgi:hypothetical protein
MKKIATAKGRSEYAQAALLAAMTDRDVGRVERDLREGGSAAAPYERVLLERGMTLDAFRKMNGLWNAVVRGANAFMGSKAGESDLIQPALKGMSGDDAAQVLSVPGMEWPGLRFDNWMLSFPDAPKDSPAAKMKGRYVKREEPAYPGGRTIFDVIGQKALKQSRLSPGWFLKTLHKEAYTKIKDWAKSVDAGRYMQFLEDDRGGEVIPVPGYEGVGSQEAHHLSNPYFLEKINEEVSRQVQSSPAQKWLWDAVLTSVVDLDKKFLRAAKGTPPVQLKATDFMDWVDSSGYEIPDGLQPTRRNVAKTWTKLYAVLQKAYNNLPDKVFEEGLRSDELAGYFRDPAVRDVYLQEMRRRRKSAAMRRAAARRVAEKWIQQAVERPGRLHEYFGIPEDEDIPVAKIKGEIAKLKKKEERSAEETSLLRALNMALTLKGMNKGAGLDPVSLGEMMLSAAAQIRLFHNLEGAYDRYLGVYEEMGQNLVRLGHTTDADDREFLRGEINDALRYLRGRAGEIHRASEAMKGLADAYDLVAKAYR